MSTKRILGVTAFSVLFIIALVGVMLLSLYFRSDNDALQLPETSASPERTGAGEPDALSRVEVSRDTIQSVIRTLSRPEAYARGVVIESFWEGGRVEYIINVTVADGVTSIRSLSSVGVDKNIIVTRDSLYIWYQGDRTPYAGAADSAGDGSRTADEYQKLITYEDILTLDKNTIYDAGYTEFGGEECVYVEYLSPRLGYTMKCYISIELGLITGAVEYDEAGAVIYKMTAGECVVGEADLSAFTLPDGTIVGWSDT